MSCQTSKTLRLMAVLAHPDDESLGFGGTLARCAAEGVKTFVLTATRGQRGRLGDIRGAPPDEVGRIREQELRAACQVLGVAEVCILDYMDGALDSAEPLEAIGTIAAHIRRLKPHVVLTFGPEGAYGHPDHIAISQFTTAAVMQAANSADRPQQVSKLYYAAWTDGKWEAYQSALKILTSTVDGVERQATPWPEWAVTTVVDTAEYSHVVWRAVSCHESQMSIYRRLQKLSPDQHRSLWGTQEFYRVFSLVSGGRRVESDVFEGLRQGGESHAR